MADFTSLVWELGYILQWSERGRMREQTPSNHTLLEVLGDAFKDFETGVSFVAGRTDKEAVESLKEARDLLRGIPSYDKEHQGSFLLARQGAVGLLDSLVEKLAAENPHFGTLARQAKLLETRGRP